MLYENDDLVRRVTEYVVSTGSRVFQIFQRGTEEEHVDFLLEAFNPPAGKILDVGCGIGEVAKLMKRRRADLDFVLFNVSRAQLEMCPPMDRVQGDAHKLPFSDEAFDGVMACYVMGHLDMHTALAEMRRVLKPGGVLFIYDLDAGRYLPELYYTAYKYNGWYLDDAKTDAFLRFMPNFHEKCPDVKPVVVRERKL